MMAWPAGGRSGEGREPRPAPLPSGWDSRAQSSMPQAGKAGGTPRKGKSNAERSENLVRGGRVGGVRFVYNF